MKKKKDEDLIDIMSEPYTPETHSCIADNLKELAKLLNSPLYQKSVQVFLRAQISNRLNKAFGDKLLEDREYAYSAGLVAGLRIAYGLPAATKQASEGGVSHKPPVEKGDAGY